MSKGLVLTSEDGKKEFHITASGPIDARVVFPNTEEYPMVPVDSVKPLIAKFLYTTQDAYLKTIPEITYLGTSDTHVIDNHSSITTTVLDTLGNDTVSLLEHEGILWQVSQDPLFVKDVYEYHMSGTSVQGKEPLEFNASKAVKLNLLGDLLQETGKTIYYIRFKYFQEGKPSQWSNVLDFTVGGNFYNQPSISTELEYDISNPEFLKLHNRYPLTGGIRVKHKDYSVKLGKLSEPEYINVYVGQNIKAGDEAPIHFKVPYKQGSVVVYPKLLGNGDESVFNIQPTVPFNLYITYEGKDEKGNYITSEPSNLVTSIVFPTPLIFPREFKLLQGSGKTSSIPTLVLEDIQFDYDYFTIYSSYKRERLSYIETNGGTTEDPLILNIVIDIKDLRNNPVKVITRSIDSLDVKTDESLGQYITMPKGLLQAGREYNFNLKIDFTRGNQTTLPTEGQYDYIQPIPFDIIKLDAVRMNSLDSIETENFNRPKATYPSSSSSPKFNAYYGEIVKEGDFGLMPDINYRGVIKSDTTYYLYDEVVIQDKLYIVTAKSFTTGRIDTDTYIPDPNVFIEVTTENHKAIYKSGLPTYEWLANRIGLPYKQSIYSDKEGNIKNGDPITRILNSDSGWIKCANFAKQHVFIAKRPILSNISFRELQRRFLTGEYSRTIRIGLNYYSVRLLEVGPNALIDPTWKKKGNLENPSNWQNEFELYQQLFRVVFGSYQPDDLGLDNDILSKTFVGKGVINTSSIKDSNNNIVTTVKSEEYEGDEYDNRDYTYYYRPVLELIRYDNLPLLKAKELPGSLNCNYDKWSDTGYYGEVGVDSFMTPEEIKSVFNLPYLQVTKEPVAYHKFYYHGLTMYIPNRPIGMVSKEDMKLFNKSGYLYGTDGDVYTFRGSKYIMSLPNLQTSLYMDKHRVNNHNGYVTSRELLQHVHDDSIIGGLVNRVSNIFHNLLPGDEHKPANHPSFIKDLNSGLDTSVNNGVFLKDLILDKNMVDEEVMLEHYSYARFKDGKVLTGTDPLDKQEYNTSLYLWPVFITETVDLTRDFSYPNLVSPVPTITYEKKKVIKYEVVPKVLKRERQIKKTRKEKYPVQVTVSRPIDTGRHTYEDIEIFHPEIGINLAFTYAKRSDQCYFTKPLYERSMLNVKHIGNEYVVRWSSKIKTLEDYLLRSCLIQSVKQGYRYPIPFNKKFEDTREMKSYLKSLVADDITIGATTNDNYDRIQSLDNKYPLGMFYGTVSSKDIVYPIPRWYKLYEDNKKEMTRYPMIRQDNDNNWVNDFSYVVNDKDMKLPIPLMSGYLAYEDFSPYGKVNIIEPIVRYITNITYKDRVNLESVDKLMESVREEYVFGVFGLELKTARVLEGGINEGKPDNPRLITMDGQLPEFMGMYTTVKDILNPIKEVEKENIVTTVWKERDVIYFELEEYEETIYEEVRVEKEITVPVITYV